MRITFSVSRKTTWNIFSQIIHVRVSKGNEGRVFDGFGLFYYRNGQKVDIGCPYDDGSNCWIDKSAMQGGTNKITVRRVNDKVQIYIGNSHSHTFSGFTKAIFM